MFSKSFKLFKIFGISIELDASWFIIFFFVVWTLSTSLYKLNLPGITFNINITLSVVTAILFFSSVIFHELAHSIIAIKEGLAVKKITLFVFGGAALIDDEPKTPGTEFRISVLGPASSLFLALFFFIFSQIFENYQYLHLPGLFLFNINLILAFFNLIPGFPMDGGRIFRSFIWYISGNFLKSTKIAAALGKIIALTFVSIGLYSIVITGLSGLWLILIGLFLYKAADGSLKQAQIKDTC